MKTTAVGFYGKIPTVGDFVQRRLAASFVDAWDEWLQAGIAVSREQLGDAWLDCYLGAPIWRFVISGGLCGSDAHAGILVPSVDRVGRYYPLTFAITVPNGSVFNTVFPSDDSWFVDLERVALDVLKQDAFCVETLDAALLNIALPGFVQNYAISDDLSPVTDFYCSLWWVQSTLDISSALLCCSGMPPAKKFASLLRVYQADLLRSNN